MRLMLSRCAIVLALLCSACATTTTDPDIIAARREANDPWEEINRKVLVFNIRADQYVLRPVAIVYLNTVPPPGRSFVNNFLRNINTPYTLVHDLLQGEFERANVSFGRFIINSTIGLGGLFDPASALGYDHHSEDFGQTLAVWGAPSGPYMVLPFLGPSTVRGTIGTALDASANRLGTAADAIARAADLEEFVDIVVLDLNDLNLGLTAAAAINARAQVHDILEEIYSADDPYILIRTGYQQNRAKEIANGRAFQTQQEEDIFEQEF